MKGWRSLSRGARALFDRKATDREIADEVESYLDHATAAGMERGLSAEDARREARLEMGSPAVVREQVRESGWENSHRHAARRFAVCRAEAIARSFLQCGNGADDRARDRRHDGNLQRRCRSAVEAAALCTRGSADGAHAHRAGDRHQRGADGAIVVLHL